MFPLFFAVNIVRKIEEVLFYFLLFAIPFQTRKILWQENWYFNDWQAIYVYGTDLLFLILVLFWIFRRYAGISLKSKVKSQKSENQDQCSIPKIKLRIYDWFLLGFLRWRLFQLKIQPAR